MPHTLTKSSAGVLTSLLWNYGGAAAALILQLAYTAYTGRAVAPQAFGTYATAVTVTQILGYFANAGLCSHVLRCEMLTRQLAASARRASWCSGFLLFLVAEASVPVAARLWQMPELAPMLAVLGTQFIVQPAALTTAAALRRIGRARAAVTAELGGQLGASAVAATLLAAGWNPLGLAAAAPAGSGLTAIAAAIALASAQLPEGPAQRARDLIRPAGFLALTGLWQSSVTTAPLWMAGRVLGPTSAGYYSRASLLLGIPLTHLAQGLNRSAAPALADTRGTAPSCAVHSDRSLDHAAVEDLVCAASATAFIVFGVAAGLGPAALMLLLGPGWDTAARLVPLLALDAVWGLLYSVCSTIDQVRGSDRSLIRTQAAATAAMAVGLGCAAAAHSLTALACAAAVASAIGHTAQLLRWHRSGVAQIGPILRMHLAHAVIGGGLCAVGLFGSDGRPPLTGLICGAGAMLPVVAIGVALRAWLPVHSVAVRRGLLPAGRRPRETDSAAL